MSPGLSDWTEIAAIVSAMCDVITTGRDTFKAFYEHHINAPDTRRQATVLQHALSYSAEELEAIKQRLNECRERFIAEGGGQQRTRCICSVLRNVKNGNGGKIPLREWEKAYKAMACVAMEEEGFGKTKAYA